jgi:hypothetical protein
LGALFSSSSDSGERSVAIEHSPDAQAVVLEFTNGETVVIRPGGVGNSMYEWFGSDLLRFTIFWPDGTTTEEIRTG